MNIDPSITGSISALWLTAAILAGGYARTRNRSAWTWFLLTLFLGPIAAFLLVTWPLRDLPATDVARSDADESLGTRT